MDNAKLQMQIAYLRRIKNMRTGKLRRLHREVFKHTKWYIKLPQWMHRSLMERRLFYYFAANNYHYERDHPLTKSFRDVAKHILSKEYAKSIDPEEEAQQKLKDITFFTKETCDTLPIKEVDRYLSSLGLYIEADEVSRRTVLWEWFNRRSSDLIKHLDNKGSFVRATRRGDGNNKFYLRDLILENPTLDYDSFRERYGEQMPTVTRVSYNVARCMLRKAGYAIPRLKPGLQNPALKRGVYGQGLVRGRKLNKINFEETDNGKA